MSCMVPTLFKGQCVHLGFLVVAIPLMWLGIDCGALQWNGLPVSFWFWLAVLIPIIHQTYVWLCWRLELRNRLFTNQWGLKTGFGYYVVGFFLLFSCRFISLFILAVANQDTVSISWTVRWLLAVPILLVAGYTLFSVKRYFGFQRAAGLDHFDPAFHRRALVHKGMFRWTKNAMYIFAIQSTWLFGILMGSRLAMIAACFQSVYIWVHFLGTEKPDMDYIYR